MNRGLRYNCVMNTQMRDITIQLNGSPHSIPGGQSVASLLASLELANQRVAIEVNANVVPRSEYTETLLQEGDRVEIIRAIGGG